MSSPHHETVVYDDPAAPPRICQNCRNALRGPYCAQCGQHDVDYHRSFHHLTHDLLENLFHFEGKFFSSVAWLLAKPGKLTAEFNAGRRQSQLNPLRFYIFVTVLFFLGVHLLNHGHIFPFDRKKADTLTRNLQEEVAKVRDVSDNLTPAQKERFGELLGEMIGARGGRIDDQAVRDLIERVQKELPGPVAAGDSSSPVSDSGKNASTKPKSRAASHQHPDFLDTLKHKFVSGDLTLSLVLDEIEHRVPTLLFLGMPVFALLLKLLYIRSRTYYIEHLIFSIHLHTWAFLVVMVSNGYFRLAGLASAALAWLLGVALFFWMAGYVFAAFRVVYRQGAVKTLLKVGLLSLSYFCALMALSLTIIIGTVWWLVQR